MTEREREGVPRGFESPYERFLWEELSIIRALEREGEFYKALKYATSLTKYLDPRVREKHHEEGKLIIATVDYNLSKTKSYDFYTTATLRNREAKRLGERFLEEFLTALTDTMGTRSYMEKRGASPSRPSKKRMGVPEE